MKIKKYISGKQKFEQNKFNKNYCNKRNHLMVVKLSKNIPISKYMILMQNNVKLICI